MTEEQQRLADDKMRAEIAKLIEEATELRARTTKQMTENKWYPAVIASGATLAIVAVAKIFL